MITATCGERALPPQFRLVDPDGWVAAPTCRYGGPENEILDGGNGNDTIVDTEGSDSLSGGSGNATIVTADGTGGDTANGGLGTDTCTTDANDTRDSC